MLAPCRYQNRPVRVPFSKSNIFKICRQKICCLRVNKKPIRHIFRRFQNVPASFERSLNYDICGRQYGKEENDSIPQHQKVLKDYKEERDDGHLGHLRKSIPNRTYKLAN